MMFVVFACFRSFSAHAITGFFSGSVCFSRVFLLVGMPQFVRFKARIMHVTSSDLGLLLRSGASRNYSMVNCRMNIKESAKHGDSFEKATPW